MQQSYNNYAKYYDLIFQKKDYDKEANFIKSIVQKNAVIKDSILDIGCGTGSHLSFLKKDFKTLFGIDTSKQILTIAKKKIPSATFLQGDMRNFQIKEKFNVITCLYSVFNYNLNLKDALRTLKNIYKHLKSNGVVIIALYNERSPEKQISLHIGENRNTKVAKINEFRYSPKEKILKSDHLLLIKKKGEFDFDVEIEDKFRIFDFSEIKDLAKKSGFKQCSIYDNFSFDTAKENKSKYPVIVLKKTL